MTITIESEQARRARARRRSLTTLAVVIVLLFFGLWYAKSYLDNARGSGTPATSSSPSCPATTTPHNTFAVNVYNATKRNGLAASTSKLIGKRGFKIGTVANDPAGKKIAAPAEIRFGPSGEANAKLVQTLVEGAVMVQDTRPDASVDLVIGDGFSALTAEPTTTKPPGC